MITVKKVGRTWNVYIDGILHEGGFFHRENAEKCAEELRDPSTAEAAEREHEQRTWTNRGYLARRSTPRIVCDPEPRYVGKDEQ